MIGAVEAQEHVIGARRPAPEGEPAVPGRGGSEAPLPGETAGGVRCVDGHVSWITIAPVKGLALVARETVARTEIGVPEDRRFYVIDARTRASSARKASASLVGAVHTHASVTKSARYFSLTLSSWTSTIAWASKCGVVRHRSRGGRARGGGRRRRSIQVPFHGPPRQLVAGGQLELAQDRGHVRLDGLGGDAEPQRDLLVEVAAGDVAQDLALARGELVELGRRSAGRRRGPPANASSTKPARRGEKTASPLVRRGGRRRRARRPRSSWSRSRARRRG